MSRVIRCWIQDLGKGVAGNCSETETKTQQRVLKCGERTNRLQGVAGNCSEVIYVGFQGVAGNLLEELKSN